MSRQRPLHVVDHWRPVTDGYASRGWALLDAQAARDDLVPGVAVSSRHELHADAPPERHPDVPLWHVLPTGLERLHRKVRRWAVDGRGLTRALVDIGGEHRADVVHVHWSSVLGSAAADAADRLDVPLVAEVRFDLAGAVVSQTVQRDVPWLERLLRRRFERHLQRADGVVAASDTLADLVAGLRPDLDVHVVRNGVDAERFRPGEGDPARFGASGDRPVVGVVSNLLRYEGFDRLLPLLPDRADGLLVGGGPELHGLRAAADALPHDRWHLPGPVPRALAPLAWRSIDVVVLPRRATAVTRYASPLKLVEAMASGRAVVATAVGDVPALLGEDRGVLVAPDDDAALREAVAALVDDPDRRAELGAAARAHVEATCSWQQGAATATAIYEDVAGRR